MLFKKLNWQIKKLYINLFLKHLIDLFYLYRYNQVNYFIGVCMIDKFFNKLFFGKSLSCNKKALAINYSKSKVSGVLYLNMTNIRNFNMYLDRVDSNINVVFKFNYIDKNDQNVNCEHIFSFTYEDEALKFMDEVSAALQSKTVIVGKILFNMASIVLGIILATVSISALKVSFGSGGYSQEQAALSQSQLDFLMQREMLAAQANQARNTGQMPYQINGVSMEPTYNVRQLPLGQPNEIGQDTKNLNIQLNEDRVDGMDGLKSPSVQNHSVSGRVDPNIGEHTNNDNVSNISNDLLNEQYAQLEKLKSAGIGENSEAQKLRDQINSAMNVVDNTLMAESETRKNEMLNSIRNSKPEIRQIEMKTPDTSSVVARGQKEVIEQPKEAIDGTQRFIDKLKN